MYVSMAWAWCAVIRMVLWPSGERHKINIVRWSVSVNKQFSVHLFWIQRKTDWVCVQVYIYKKRLFQLFSLYYKLWMKREEKNYVSCSRILLTCLVSKRFIKVSAWRNKSQSLYEHVFRVVLVSREWYFLSVFCPQISGTVFSFDQTPLWI